MSRVVALVHGWGGSYAATFRAAGWEEALRLAGLEPFGLDLPGHGPQGEPRDPAAYADLASGLEARLPPEIRDCIGFSLGTKLLLELESRRPGRFDRLVLGGIGDNLFAPEASGAALSAVLRGQADLEAASPGVRALTLYSRKSGADPLALAAILERPPNPQASEARLAKVKARILLVNGSEDAVALPDLRLRRALPAADYEALEGVGHVALTEDPRFLAAAVRFLAQGAKS